MSSDQITSQRKTVTITASVFAIAHGVLGALAFIVALLTCLQLHYRRVVKNHVAGYPDEWWPSVSATVGDWFPERNVFQIICAATSGARFLMIAFCGMLAFTQARPIGGSFLTLVGVLRTISCGGWIFVTSTDHSLVHDVMMGLYIGLTPLWMGLCLTQLGPRTTASERDMRAHKNAQVLRVLSAIVFYACTPFMVHFYLQHRVQRIPGMYTRYSILEWTLVAMDILFDTASAWDLKSVKLDVSYTQVLPVMSENKRNELAKNESVFKRVPQGHLEWPWIVSQAFLAFTAWSQWFGLLPTIFYFSVSNMAAEGVELFVLAQFLALAIVAISPLERLMHGTYPGSICHPHALTTALAWLMSLCGVAAYAVRDPFMRLAANAASCAVLAVLSAVDWSHAWEAGRLNECIGTWLIGLLGTVVVRYGNHANIPTWVFLDETNGGQHVPALCISAICFLPYFVPALRRIAPSHARRSHEHMLRPHASFVMSALAVGTWLIEMQTLLSDSGTIIAFGWTGYPLQGPQAVTHGVWVISAMALGIAVSLWWPRFGTTNTAIGMHAFGMFGVFVYDNWMSFVAGLCVAFTLPTMALPLWHSAMEHHPIRIMTLAWLIATLFAFLGVLTTAYAFLPGAYFMREHTGALMAIETCIVSLGAWHARRNAVKIRSVRPTSAQAMTVMRTLYALLVALVCAAGVVPFVRYVPPSAIQPHFSNDRVLTAGIWTVHFGFDQLMRDSSRRMSSILSTVQLDVIGLLESDLHRPAFGNRDLTQWLAEELGMYADLGPSPKKHTWGATLLSKFPIINSTHHLLPSPRGELAPAIHAVLDVWGVPTHVVVSHNGQEEDALDRELQTTELARILSDAYPHPAIFLGYVVTKPHAPRPNPYQILFEDGRIIDVDSSDNDRWCQYLGFRGLHRVAYARVSRYTVTDTELQTFKLHVPESTLDPDHDARPRRISGRVRPDVPWAYPTSLINPSGWVNESHIYAPYIYPRYYYPFESDQMDETLVI